MNPLLIRHLYGSVRRNRFFWLLSLYLVGVGLLTLLFSLLTSLPVFFDETATTSMVQLFTQGRALYWFSSILLLFTSMLLVPITVLGAVSGERENRTLDLLLASTLKSRDIIFGKLGSALLNGALYVLAPFPLLMTGFWIGGVTTAELGITLLCLLLTMALSIAWALCLSSLVRKTITAVILFYTLNLIVVPVLVVVITVVVGLLSNWGAVMTRALVPLWLEALIQHGWVLLVALHPVSAAVATEALGLEQGSWLLLDFTVQRYDPAVGSFITLGTITLPSPWILFTILALLTTAILLWISLRRLRRSER